jgi:hypothetical protein
MARNIQFRPDFVPDHRVPASVQAYKSEQDVPVGRHSWRSDDGMM